jgi:threonine dehydrogenase-like Zn-dependent dehydrogenase
MLAGKMSGNHIVELIDIPEPVLPPKTDETSYIIFQPEIGCLCGSDVPYFTGADIPTGREVTHSLHEMIGSVVETNGSRFKPGDRVLAVPFEQKGLAERYVLPEGRAIPLDTRVSEEEAMMAQPLGTVIYALRKLPNLIGKNVAIVGQGPIGQLYTTCIKNLGAKQVIAIDQNKDRLALSKEMGATCTIDTSTQDVISEILNLTDQQGCDIVIEAIGHDEVALNLCIDLSKKFGIILFFGVPSDRVDDIRLFDLLKKNIQIITSIDPDFSIDFPLAMQWIGEGRIDVSKILTHRYPLENIQQAFELFRDRKDGCSKVLIEFPSYSKS